MKPVISLKNVGVTFAQRSGMFSVSIHEVLSGISFDIFEGDSVAIIGRNGAGKSTILKLLAGILEPDTGTVSADHIKTALLVLQLGFDPNLSGKDNAIMSGMLLGYSRQEVTDIIDEIFDFAEITEFKDEPLRIYSTGMRARLGFSVATYMQPDVLLIDEVLGVGDFEFRKKSKKIMMEKLKSRQTVVLVSHNLHEISELCNRAIWIEGGKIKLSGETDFVINEYRNFFS